MVQNPPKYNDVICEQPLTSETVQCLKMKDDDEQTISDPIATVTFLQKKIIKTIF